jgi:hypothetical protein
MRRREFGLGTAAMWPSMARAKALGLTIPETLLERKARFSGPLFRAGRLQAPLLQLRRGYDGPVRDPTPGGNLNQKSYIR